MTLSQEDTEKKDCFPVANSAEGSSNVEEMKALRLPVFSLFSLLVVSLDLLCDFDIFISCSVSQLEMILQARTS